MNNLIYIFIIMLVALGVASIVIVINASKQVKKDWDTYNDLEILVKNVSTKEQANSLYIKIANFQKNLHNSIIEIRIGYLFAFLDGFLKAKENE